MMIWSLKPELYAHMMAFRLPDLVLWVLSQAAQLSKFQLNARDLRHGAVGRPSRRVSRSLPDIHVRERNL